MTISDCFSFELKANLSNYEPSQSCEPRIGRNHTPDGGALSLSRDDPKSAVSTAPPFWPMLCGGVCLSGTCKTLPSKPGQRPGTPPPRSFAGAALAPPKYRIECRHGKNSEAVLDISCGLNQPTALPVPATPANISPGRNASNCRPGWNSPCPPPKPNTGKAT